MPGIPFEIEAVMAQDGQRAIVVARQLEPGEIVLGRSPRLGGRQILRRLTQPRALHPDGSPRTDLFAFALRIKSDVDRFQSGQRVLLEP